MGDRAELPPETREAVVDALARLLLADMQQHPEHYGLPTDGPSGDEGNDDEKNGAR